MSDERESWISSPQILVQSAIDERESQVQFHDVLEEFVGYNKVLGREFTRLCTYLGAHFSISTTPTTYTPSPPPSDTTIAPLVDYTMDPSFATVDATISNSYLIEHLPVDPVMLSTFATDATILSKSFVSPPSYIPNPIV